MVVRLAENGCLLNHLRKNRENPYINVENKQFHFTRLDKLKIARDVANGMLHLSSKVVWGLFGILTIIKLQLGKKFHTLFCSLALFRIFGALLSLKKMRGYTQFSFWTPIALAKIIAISRAKIPRY